MKDAQPDCMIVLLGPPRSGTTLIANAMSSHSKTISVIEPYQRRRDAGYAETQPFALMQDFDVDLANRPALIIKETTTRKTTLSRRSTFCKNARDQGLYTGLVVILRCPYSAYLSQVEASQTMWAQKKLAEISPTL